MNISYHHRTLGDGAEGVHIAEIVRALREEGHEVEVHSPIGARTNAPNPRAARLARLRRKLPRALFEAAEVAYGAVGGARLGAALARRRPHLLYERYALANAAGAIAARAAGVPFVLEVNSPLALERQVYEGGLRFPRALQRIETWIFRRADRCVAVSTPLGRHLERVGADPARVVVLPNGADPARFDPAADGRAVRERWGIAGRPVVGFIGVVRPWHGLDLLARAFARAAPPGATLLVVGDGPACGDLVLAAADLGIGDRLRITGRIPHERVPEHIAAMDVAVSPRATFYASPMKIPEYMAGGRPVVAPRMANIEDLLDDGRTGLLFDPECEESLAAALGRLLPDADLRRRIGAAAREEVEMRLNWRANARRIAALAHEIAAEKRAALAAPAGPRARTMMRRAA